MKRSRSMALVTRGDQILLVEHHFPERNFYILHGGGIEENESPEEAALRELFEECGVVGEIIRPLNITFKEENRKEYTFEVKIAPDAEVVKGGDPELSEEEQVICSVGWKRLSDLNERDRAYLWSYGLIRLERFHEETMTWGNRISYPGRS